MLPFLYIFITFLRVSLEEYPYYNKKKVCPNCSYNYDAKKDLNIYATFQIGLKAKYVFDAGKSPLLVESKRLISNA